MTGASGAGEPPDRRRSKLTSGDGRMQVAVRREEHRGCVSYRVVPVYHDDGPEATFARRSEALRVAAAIIAEYERKIGDKHGGE